MSLPGGSHLGGFASFRPKSELHELVIDGAVVPLQRFLDEHSTDVDLNAWDAYGFAPLHLAADRGESESASSTRKQNDIDKTLRSNFRPC